MPDIASALIYYLVFLLSTTIHEAAHAWAAMLGGDLTAYHGGQVSLSPVPHIKREPFGMVILPLLSVAVSGWPFGYASAPYDLRWAMAHPKRAAWMALAGPASNLLLVLLALIAIRVGTMTGVFFPPDSVGFDHLTASGSGIWESIGFFISVLFSLNLVLATLNLLPLPPLDGSAAVPLLLNDDQTSRYQRFIHGNPAFSWIGILIAWQLFDYVWTPIFHFAINLLYAGVSYG